MPFITFLGFFAIGARNVLDPDIWWHLKAGEWIVQHHAVPHADPFSYTFGGHPWIAHEWLAELLIYRIFQLAGFGGLIVTFAAIISAAFIPLYLRCSARPIVAAVMTLWGALATTVIWGARPQIIALLLFSIWLLLLERSEQRPEILWWTLPLIVLWVNLHASFILGPVFVGIFLVGESIELFFRRTRLSPSKQRIRWLAFALLVQLALIPLNPNGVKIFMYPIETIRSSSIQNRISEWASPNFHSVDYAVFFLLLLFTFVVLSASSRQIRPRDAMLLLVGVGVSLVSVRMLPLFVLTAVPLLARCVESWLPRNRSEELHQTSGKVLINACIVASVLTFAFLHTRHVIANEAAAEAAHYPAGAVAFLKAHPPTGRVFNHYDWGGYFIFHLHPTTKVFIDGRADIYGDDFMQQFDRAYYLQDEWQQPLRRWNVETVIVPPDSSMASALRLSESWKVEYQDSVAAIFTKSSGPLE